ncbi:carbohydrate ABC transporter substrate-binding protein, CUT1 family [Caldanaerobius fijiensis DSM 17918]|uniref:Carbohydrate ABC transporter substrate-binding protein, CUT1 family n=1 Tax=Caldanaerobius fijiensis DSM 17918 TaxID=1121256 RepID=A0A1M4SXT5_9THEO|nr:ABC transporter substrate-binding protein [Caldanaerobius fijiensis]SHE37033.1 carbohydrate ABC transporter substrate-binding protein, CUT1 family [Caldanaerobius fijiensis DSM 17918]
MFKKLIAVILIAGMILSLTACGGGSSSKTTSASKAGEKTTSANQAAKKGQPVEITYWHMWTSDWQKVIENIVDQFNKTHPDIHVKPVSIPSNADQKFLTAVASGTPPDVFTEWNMIIATFADKGAILSYDELMPQIGEKVDDLKSWLYPICKEIGTYKGKLYGLPFSMNDFMMFYNKKIFEEVGLDPNKPPQTIEELDSMQAKMWKYDSRGMIQRIGFFPGWWALWDTAFGGNEGYNPNTDKFTFTDPQNVKVMEWFQSYSKKYDISKVDAFNKSNSNTLNNLWPFLSGRVAFAVDGMWRLIDIQKYAPDLQYGVIPLPYPKDGGKPNASWINGNFNIIPKGTKHPKEAVQFVLWLTGYKNEQVAAKDILPPGGWLPASPKIAEEPDYQKWVAQIPERKKFVDLMSSPNLQITPVIPVQQYMSDRIGNAEDLVKHLKKQPLQAMIDLQKEVEAEYQKVKSSGE